MQSGLVTLSAGVDPFRPARIGLEFQPGMTLLDLVDRALEALARKMKCSKNSLAWFYDVGLVDVGHTRWPRAMWGMVRPKAGAHVELLAPFPGKGGSGKLLMVLAAVALTVVTAGIAGGALAGALGAGSLAAGSLGATALAAGVGLAGQLALRALTPSPSLPKPNTDAQRELSLAGFGPNQLQRDDVLARVAGLMRISPQPLVPAYTVLQDKKQYVKAVVGLEGMYDISDIRINEVPITDIDGAEYEVAPGDGSTPDTFLSEDFTLEERQGLTLTNFELREEENELTELKDQTTPANSYSKWHPLPDKPAAATRYGFRLVFDGGIANTAGEDCAVPIRIRIRVRGSGTWRYLPELHFKDLTGTGPFQQYVTLFFGSFNGGFWATRNDAINCYVAIKQAGAGQWWEFNADSYFANLGSAPATQVPVMAGYTSGAVTVSASSEQSGATPAWQAFDASTSTYWQPSDNTLPGAWLKVDWGSGNTKTILAYTVNRNAHNTEFPNSWELQGSNDNATWTTLHEQDNTGLGIHYQYKYLNVSVVGAFRYHRVVFNSNRGAANEELSVGTVELYTDFSMARLYASGGFANPEVLGGISARNVSLRPDGAEINLTEASWPNGIYEIQVRRGWAYVAADMDLDSGGTKATDQYIYDGDAAFGYFFDAGTDIHLAQNDIQSRTTIAITQKYFPIRPIAAAVEPKLTRLAISIPSLEIQSISFLAQGYAREHNGSTWVDEAVPSTNRAAYYRDALLLADINKDYLPGEVINEDELIEFFDHAADYPINAILQGRNVAEVLTLFAAGARARPKHGGQWGIAIDHDRSAESPVALLTPENSRDAGTEVAFDQIPHALRVSYFDADDDYKLKDLTVYRAGYTSANATEIESIEPYIGLVTEAEAQAQAEYDFGQMLHRKATFKREVGLQGISYGIGDLLAISDEVVSRDTYYGLVKSILTSGGNVTGFEIYGTAELTQSAEAISEEEGVLGTFGCMVQLKEGGTFTAEITEQADTSTITLATPVANTSQFAVDLPISIGALTIETKRVVVQNVEHMGGEEFRLSLLPEGNQIFA